MNVLVIAEHDNHDIKPTTLSTVAAASKFSSEVTLLVMGYQCEEAVKQAERIEYVSKILVADDVAYGHHLAENLSCLVAEIARPYEVILAPASTYAKNFIPRVAALLDVEQISDVKEIISPDTFVRPIFAGNAMATVTSTDSIKILTIRSTAFDAVNLVDKSAVVERLNIALDMKLSKYLKSEISVSERPELTDAKIVVSGGRGLQSGENFKLIEQLADKLHAAIGASRAAVDAGFVPNDYQVGQTGKIVAPELYIAIGISGAIQHLAGMKDSKVIVAINKDEEAPIFKIATYGLVGDLFELVPQLIAALEKNND